MKNSSKQTRARVKVDATSGAKAVLANSTALTLTLLFGGAAHADLVTSIPSGVTIATPNNGSDFSGPAFPGLTTQHMISGPVDVSVTSTNSNWVFGWTGGYGLNANGNWSGLPPIIGTNSPTASVTFTFNGEVGAVGGNLNYGPNTGPITITALDSNGNVLESYSPSFSTPNATNGSVFYGISRTQNDIASFRIQGAYAVLRNLTYADFNGDVTPPTLNITGPVATQTGPFTVNFNFSEDVVGFTAIDVVPAVGTQVSNFSGSGASYSMTVTPLADGPVGVSVAAGTYEDAVGNDNTASSSFSVQADITAPSVSGVNSSDPSPVNGPFTISFTFNENITGFTADDVNVVNGTPSNLTGSGASYSFVITPSTDGMVYFDLPAGVVQDAAGNPNVASAVLDVEADLTAPVIITPGTLNVGTDPGQTTAVVTYSVTANDPGHGALTPTLVSGPASGSAFPLGTTTISYSATDAAGNVSNASFDIIVSDDEDPTIVGLPGNISVNTDPGLATAVVSWTPPTANDNAPGASVTQTAGPAPGSAFPIGATVITYEAEDAAGNVTTQSFNVTVQDAEPPAFAGFPANISINVDYPAASAVASWTAPTVTDNAPGATVTQIGGPASGSSFPLGTTTITYRAQDVAGNIVNQSFTVTVAQNPPGQVRFVIDTGEDGAFVFTSATPGFNFTINTVGGDGSTTVTAAPGVFNLAFALPAGFGILSADCDDTNSTLNQDAQTGAINLAANELITCTIVTVDSLTETSRLVGAFIGARAQLILQNMPDADRRIDRLNGRAASPGGVSAFGLNVGRGDLPFDLSFGQDRANFSFSLAGMRAQREQNRGDARAARQAWGDGRYDDWTAQPRSFDFGEPRAAGAGMNPALGGAFDTAGLANNLGSDVTNTGTAAGGETGPTAGANSSLPGSANSSFDLWLEGTYAQFDTSVGSGDFYMMSGGADWIANTNLLIGFGLQVDWTDMTGPLANSSIQGTGYLAGPYVTARLREGLFFDGHVAWGQSFNQVSPFGVYEDDVDAERGYLSAALIGDVREGNWTFRPEGRISYFREETEAYIDSLSVAIPSLEVETGTVTFSPMIRYRHTLASDSTLEPYFALETIYTFRQRNSAAFALGNSAFIGEGARGRFEGGFDFTQPGGMSLGAMGFYDGIGEDDFSSWGAQLRMAWSFGVAEE